VGYRCALFAGAAIFTQSLLIMAQNTAGVQGAVVDAVSGKPVPGAVVLVTSTSPAIKAPALTKSTVTGLDGGYQIQAMPAGTYSLCVQAPRPTPRVGYLNSCHWGAAPANIMLAAGQKSTNNTVKLRPGSVLLIEVEDSAQLLSHATKSGLLPDLVMGVWSGGMFYPPTHSIKGPGKVHYLLPVPTATNLKFSIQSKSLVLGNASHAPLVNSMEQVAFQHPANGPPPPGPRYAILSAKP